MRVLETDLNDQVLTGGLLVLNFPRIYFAESVKFSQPPQDVGVNFFLLFFGLVIVKHLLIVSSRFVCWNWPLPVQGAHSATIADHVSLWGKGATCMEHFIPTNTRSVFNNWNAHLLSVNPENFSV